MSQADRLKTCHPGNWGGVCRTKERNKEGKCGRQEDGKGERGSSTRAERERAEGRGGKQRNRLKEKTHTYPWLMALCI